MHMVLSMFFLLFLTSCYFFFFFGPFFDHHHYYIFLYYQLHVLPCFAFIFLHGIFFMDVIISTFFFHFLFPQISSSFSMHRCPIIAHYLYKHFLSTRVCGPYISHIKYQPLSIIIIAQVQCIQYSLGYSFQKYMKKRRSYLYGGAVSLRSPKVTNLLKSEKTSRL